MSAYDRQITVFSPEGRLFQVEYAFKAIANEGPTTLGVRGDDCAVLVAQRKVPDRLVQPESVTSLHAVTAGIGAAATGMPADARAVVSRLRHEAAEFRYKFGHAATVDVLGRRLADLSQLCTQQAAMRPYGVGVTLIGMDRMDDGRLAPQVYRCDPAGFCTAFAGCATGARAADATAALEKAARPLAPVAGGTPPGAYSFGATLDETVDAALASLAAALGQDLRADDVEVGVVSAASPSFRVLPRDEVDALLTRLAERD